MTPVGVPRRHVVVKPAATIRSAERTNAWISVAKWSARTLKSVKTTSAWTNRWIRVPAVPKIRTARTTSAWTNRWIRVPNVQTGNVASTTNARISAVKACVRIPSSAWRMRARISVAELSAVTVSRASRTPVSTTIPAPTKFATTGIAAMPANAWRSIPVKTWCAVRRRPASRLAVSTMPVWRMASRRRAIPARSVQRANASTTGAKR